MENKNILLSYSGSRNDNNHNIEIINMYRNSRVGLLRVRNFNKHGTGYFPTDTLDKLAFHCENRIDCYSVDGGKLAEFLRGNADHSYPLASCQYCQIGIELIKDYFIKKKGYDQLLHYGPLFDERLCKEPAYMVLDHPEFVRWDDPVLDYRIVSHEVEQHCLRNSCLGWDKSWTMPLETIREVCRMVLESGILDRMVLRHIEFDSEWNDEYL